MIPRTPGSLAADKAHSVLMTAVLLVSACSTRTEIPTIQVEQAQRPVLQESWDIVLSISERGLPRIRIAAWHMERYDDPDSLFTLLDSDPEEHDDRVHATFFDSIGVESGVLTAEFVRFDEEGEQLIATGDVHVRVASGRLLQTEALNWDQAERKIVVPGFVYLETEDERIRGFEMESDENLDNYVIHRITGTVVIREDRE